MRRPWFPVLQQKLSLPPTAINENTRRLADAVVALPGGVGTLEELTEAITLKQLGLFKGSIIILNTRGFYNTLIRFLEELIDGQFLRFEHKGIWQLASTPEEAVGLLLKNEPWIHDPRSIAKI